MSPVLTHSWKIDISFSALPTEGQNYRLSIGVDQVSRRMNHILSQHVEYDEAAGIVGCMIVHIRDVEIAVIDSQSNQIEAGERGALVVEASVDLIRGIEVRERKGGAKCRTSISGPSNSTISWVSIR